MPEINPWDRLKDESDAAYEAFGWYLGLPGPKRLVGDAYYKKRGIPRPTYKDAPGGWRAWAKLYRWAERAEAYDLSRGIPRPIAKIGNVVDEARKARKRDLSEGEVERRKEIAAFVKERAGITVTDEELDWADQRRKVRMDDMDLSNRVIQKCREMLDVALIKRRVIPADPENGKPEIQIFEPAKWSFKTMAEMLQIAVQIRRLSAEMPTKIADDKQDGGGDDESMFVETVGQLEASLASGVVPPMPVDVTRRPEPARPGAADAAAVSVPDRSRPGPPP